MALINVEYVLPFKEHRHDYNSNFHFTRIFFFIIYFYPIHVFMFFLYIVGFMLSKRFPQWWIRMSRSKLNNINWTLPTHIGKQHLNVCLLSLRSYLLYDSSFTIDLCRNSEISQYIPFSHDFEKACFLLLTPLRFYSPKKVL